MKIAFVSKFTYYPGGVESVTQQLQELFHSAGHTTAMFSTEGFTRFDRFKSKVFSEQRILSARIARHLETFDVVICNGEWGDRIAHPGAVNLFHGSFWGYRNAVAPFLGPRSRYRLSALARVQKRAAKGKRVVAVSGHLKEILEEQGIRVDEVIENTVDTALFSPTKGIRNEKALFVGSADRIGKGYDIMEKIQDRGYLIDCVTSQKMGTLGWLQQRPRREMADLYRRYKLMFFPSRFEGLQVSPLEAMACGLPVVISSVGLGQKLKQEISEFVAETFDPDEYVAKAQMIESNWEAFSKKGIAYVNKHHAPSQFAAKWLTFIEGLK